MVATAQTLDVVPATQRPALAVLGGASVIGLLAALFIPEQAWGVGYPIFMFGVFGISLFMRRYSATPHSRATLLLWGLVLLFSLLVAWRDAPELRTLNLLMSGLLIGILVIQSQPGSLSRATVYDYPFRAIGALLLGFIDTFNLLMTDIAWRLIPVGARGKHLASVFRGLIIAAPLLLIFGALFANADANFEKLISTSFSFDSETLFQRTFIGVIFAWMAAGLFRRMYVVPPAPPVQSVRAVNSDRWLGPTEIGIVLGSLNLLFLLFVSTQWRYFFGGAEVVRATADLNVADFARRGFFELVAVTGLSLPILLGFHALIDPEKQAMRKLYKWLASSMLVLLAVVMQSAYMKLQLYMDSFGLTTQRLYVGACLVWLVLVFAWFAMTTLNERSNRFAWGGVVALAATIFGLNLLNPDRFVAEWTLQRQSPDKVDWSYLSSLSTDAAPALANAWPKVPAEARSAYAEKLSRAWAVEPDWRSMNWSLANHLKSLGKHQEEIVKVGKAAWGVSQSAAEESYREEGY